MDKLSSPAPASFTTITRTMSTSKQPGAEQEAAAPRRSLLPVPAKRVQGQKLKKPVFCPAPCCVQARGGERPLGPDVPYQVPDDAEQAEEEGGEGPKPPLPHLGQLRQERRRRRREEERRIKEKEMRIKERMMMETESDSSGEEDICRQEGAVVNNTAMIENAFCETIQISGRIHIQHLPCNDHQNNQTDEEYDDDPDTQECDYKAEDNTKLEELQPEFDDDTARFEPERSDAEHADLREDDDQEYETRVHDAEQADDLEVEDDDVVGDEGDEDLGEEEANVNDVPEEEGNQDWASEELEGENEYEEGHDDNEYEEGDDDNEYEEGDDDNEYEEDNYDDYDYDCDNSNSCNDCDEDD